MDNGLEVLRPYIGQELSPIPSPVAHWLKGILQEINDNGLKIAYTVREDMTNPARILHGGIIATMLDDIMGITVMVKYNPDLSTFYSTVNLHVDYLASTREGATVIAASNVIKAGNRVANVEGWLHDSSGKLLAHATCNMLKVEMRT
ncbi:MAG: hotdog fold thioesterase [Anaerolineaceae bacterium]|nr:hotdog fold thioesterase [Anaerolineaceae bacterium]